MPSLLLVTKFWVFFLQRNRNEYTWMSVGMNLNPVGTTSCITFGNSLFSILGVSFLMEKMMRLC